MSKPVIGFIGIGYMGGGMAKNIVTKGYSLYFMANKKREVAERLLGLGAKEVKSPRALAEACDIVHLCLNSSPAVEETVMGENGLLSAGRKGLIIIDTSTSDPVSTLRLAAHCAKVETHFVDAPLSRTPKEAEAGTLDCMIGAEPEILEKIYPVIETWSTNIIPMGAVGNGHKMKLVNNFVGMSYAILYSEALALARKAGLSIEQFHSVIGSGRMRSGFYDTFMQYVHDGDKNAHKFTLENALKDMSYVTALANDLGLNNPVQASVRNSFALAVAAGHGGDFIPQVSDFIARINGVQGDKNSTGGADQ